VLLIVVDQPRGGCPLAPVPFRPLSRLRERNRVRCCPRVRTSRGSKASLSCSMQL